MKVFIAKVLASMALLCTSGAMTAQSIYFCPKAYISGLESLADEAKGFLSSPTSDLNQMEVYVTPMNRNLYLQSNYQPVDAEYPLKILVQDIPSKGEFPSLKPLVKYLTNPEEVEQYSAVFERAYRDNVTLYIDPAIYTNPAFKNMEFGNAKNVKFIAGNSVYEGQTLRGLGEDALVEARENTYVRVVPEKICDAVGNVTLIRDFVEYVRHSDDVELRSGDITSDIEDEDLITAANHQTLGEFFDAAASSGLTLVGNTCELQDKIELLVFGVYKPKGLGDRMSEAMDKLGEVRVKYNPQEVDEPARVKSSSIESDTDTDESGEGLGTFWYIVIGIVVLMIIGSFTKD